MYICIFIYICTFVILLCCTFSVRAHNLGYRGKENHSPSEANGDSVDGEEKPASVDPKVQRELDELRKVKSGVGDVLLKHLEQKSKAQPHLDPRSASRTPAADREPMYKTRYQNPIFACELHL